MRINEKAFTTVVYAVVILFILACLLPFWLVLIDSFGSENSFRVHGYQLWPSEFSLEAYKYLFKGDQIIRSYKNTVFITAVGSVLAVLLTASFAYVLANRKVKYRNIMAFCTYFTMIFGSGLVGSYLLIANWLDLKDTYWSMILPYLLNPFYAFIFVSFFRQLPFELNESAVVDGAREIRIFWQIILPISTPVIATISLFYALQYWNDWWLALLYVDDYKLHPLQIMIRQLISNINIASYVSGSSGSYEVSVPSNVIQLATVCVTIGPIILVYPFVQRYFVQGLTVGAVKG